MAMKKKTPKNKTDQQVEKQPDVGSLYLTGQRCLSGDRAGTVTVHKHDIRNNIFLPVVWVLCGVSVPV